ncbi:hypothetical protein KM043_017635 [Ampulex compressa]|nr:hypothetical protein KM043_017635 [Ampulex compressa]
MPREKEEESRSRIAAKKRLTNELHTLARKNLPRRRVVIEPICKQCFFHYLVTAQAFPDSGGTDMTTENNTRSWCSTGKLATLTTILREDTIVKAIPSIPSLTLSLLSTTLPHLKWTTTPVRDFVDTSHSGDHQWRLIMATLTA